jgi:hypothetical protein
MAKDGNAMRLYEERLQNSERAVHERKMAEADRQLAANKRVLKSARQLYEERTRDHT